MNERILENYLTPLETNLSDDAGEHPNVVAVGSTLVVDALGNNPESRQITIQAQVFHNKEVFNRCGKPLQINGKEIIQSQFIGDDYAAELDNAPLTMIILSRHMRRKMRKMVIGKDADGNDLTLENAIEIPLPDYLNSPSLQQFLVQFDAVEASIVQEIQQMRKSGK